MTERVNLAKSDAEYTRSYDNTRGVDFSEIGGDATRFADLQNMYVDYDGGADAVETVPGFRKLYSYGERINAIHVQDLGEHGKYLLVHAGKNLYRLNVDERDTLKNQQAIASLNDTKSHAFTIGEFVYVMDGETMLQIDSTGKANPVIDYGEAQPYVPTTYEECVKKEERNLLTNRYVQKITITSTDKYAFYTKGLTFAVNDEEKRCCTVTGGPKDYNGDLILPSTAIIDGKEYKVTEIAPSAFFGFSSITAVYGGSNIESIGKYAFMNCVCLEYAVFGNALKYIDYSAFCNSSAFSEIYLGLGFEEMAENAIINCNIRAIKYAGDEHDAEKIVGLDQFPDANIYYLSVPQDVSFGFPVKGDVDTVDEVMIGDERIKYSYDSDYKEVNIYHTDRYSLVGKTVTIRGTLKTTKLSPEAIFGCTVSCAHDGRIFLSGNPDFPGYVFYCQKNVPDKIFFSEADYFIDGVSDYPVTALLSAHGTLTVFKSQDDGSGSIFCHTASNKDGNEEYPVIYAHRGVFGNRAAYAISDDALFLSQSGLSSLENVSGNSYKELVCKSLSVNRRLLEEDLSKISVTEWCGYLVLCAGEHFYLAYRSNQSKSTHNVDCEWYFLNQIGTYSGGRRVFRYSQTAYASYEAHPTLKDERADGTVMSVVEDGEELFYVEGDDGVKYSVYPTDEFSGGDFSPASLALGVGKLLFFGTESGDLCIFNNDKRGVPPKYISEDPDFDPESYSALMGDKIHPYYYIFDNRPIKCILKTASDDCTIPHLEKSTVKYSLVVKAKNYAGGGFSAEVITDHDHSRFLGKYSTNRILFNNINFAGLNFSTAPYSIIPILEYERGWVEKQLSFSKECFRSPFGLCSATYRYKIKGKIKS